MFGRVDLREDGKKKKDKMRRKLFECVWLEEEKRKMMIGFRYFFPEPIKKFSQQNEKKTK